ncbi:cupin domain-containing protein [Cyanobium sp. Morenito 9A2]|uniref:cupin domain-containing protein n=1 Tax=Cyanobium sp. Morenito 9A2 TaxID=2823718 RepID=UPI0020CF392B|nr:cupin domain-containing protein [Cyanobium sp. Morenito 9A2]MCP9848362.1 cupin domain-containing protein [Cyanobium sp. Morenito 9A2]
MALARHVEVVPLEGTIAGRTFFCPPQPSDETQIAELAPDQPCELFCHRRQTDQIILMRGAFNLVVLQGRRLRRITLREDEPTLVRIPPGVPHGAITIGRRSATVVNAVIRHGPSDPRDFLPRRVPAALMDQWRQLLRECGAPEE